MSELRYNPLLGTYTMVAANRQQRPHLPKNWCPFCVGSDKVPENYDVWVYPNDFPVLSEQPAAISTPYPISSPAVAAAYTCAPAYGKCEVILYSPQHDASLYQLPLPHVTKLVQTWAERFRALQTDPQIRYIFPFENRGEEVGVTMPHPHGQLYAYPFVPLKIVTELQQCRQYYDQTHAHLFEVMNQTEIADGRRLIYQNDHFIAYIPYFTDYPFGVFIVSKSNIQHLAELNEAEQIALADMLIAITGAFDQLYNRPFPYMMCLHQAPINTPEYADCANYYRLHIEFYPPLRDRDKIKWYASSEMGAWAATNVVAVEDSAVLLRQALQQFKNNKSL